jgi:phi13 family phage major tail protein
MAKGQLVGLSDVHVAKITDTDGVITYGTPVQIAGAIDASIAPSADAQQVYGDDNVREIITAFGAIEVSFTFGDIGNDNYALLLGKEKDSNGVVIDSADDIAPDFALMFRSKKSNGEYRYVVLYKGKFNPIESSFATQQGNADHQQQPLTATFVKNSEGKVSARVDSDDTGTGIASAIQGWFTAPYVTPVTP